MLMKTVRKWRSEGLPVYFTVNTGQNIHLICEGKNVKSVVDKIKDLHEVKEVIINHPSVGARVDEKPLF